MKSFTRIYFFIFCRVSFLGRSGIAGSKSGSKFKKGSTRL